MIYSLGDQPLGDQVSEISKVGDQTLGCQTSRDQTSGHRISLSFSTVLGVAKLAEVEMTEELW